MCGATETEAQSRAFGPVEQPLLAEGHLTRRLFGAMLRRIEALPVPAG